MSIESIKKEVDKTASDLLIPMPLQRALPAPETFPVHALGNTLEPFVNKLAEVIQAPLGICAQSVLAAAALAVQGYADIDIDGRIIPLSEFFLTIGISGERKSAVDNIALYPHRTYQDVLRVQYEIDYLNWTKAVEAYNAAKKDSLQKGKTLEAKQRGLESLGFPPVCPLDPIIITEEPTYEGLIKLLITGQPSMGLFSDEGGRFIGGHGMNSDNLLKTASGLCGLWDGKNITRIRASEAPIIIAGRRVSFHLMAQPDVAQLFLSNSLLIEQGLMSRCLVIWPASTVGSRHYKDINLTHTQEFKDYVFKINEILRNPYPTVKNKANELLPKKITLSTEAKALYIAFHDEIENNVGDNKLLSSVRGFANKIPEHALRLAGILAVFKNINCTEIDVTSMTSGITLATYYLNEALRLHNSAAIDPNLALAEKLLEWLKDKSEPTVSLVDIYQNGPNQIRNASIARGLMKILSDHNWVTLIEGGLEINGILRKEVWRIFK